MDAKQAIHQMGIELTKPARKRYPRRQVVTNGLNDVWGADVADWQYCAPKNDGFRYWLVIIDCFSRFATVIPMKDKAAATTLKAIEQAVKENGGITPAHLWVDKGGEFYNKASAKWAKANNVTFYSTYSESKSVMAERLIGTLKRQVWIRFMSDHTRCWTDILPEIVDEYNNHVHSGIKMTPVQAKTAKGAAIIMKQQDQFNLYSSPGEPQPFHLGDWVRISRVKDIFEKGYMPSWSAECFTIHDILYSNPVTYHLADFGGEVIEGSFYAKELQKTSKPEVFLIETVLQRKKVKGVKMMLVKWQGYPKKFNKWIPEGSTEVI